MELNKFAPILALFPAILILFLMTKSRLPMWKTTLIGLCSTLLLALFFWKIPLEKAFSAVSFGALNAVFPIIWTLGAAMFLFRLLSVSKNLETFRVFLEGITSEKPLQALLIGVSFTMFLESVAAFGAPIAIVSAMLLGVGFPFELAASVALLSDMIPSPWGTQGMPLITLGSVTGADILSVGLNTALTVLPFSVLVSLLIVYIVSGKSGLKKFFPWAIFTGIGYPAINFCVSLFLGVSSAGMLSGIIMIFLFVILLKKKKNSSKKKNSPDAKKIFRACSPYLILVLISFLMSTDGIKDFLSEAGKISFQWFKIGEYSANFFTNGGTLVFVSTVLSLPLLRVSFSQIKEAFSDTVKTLLKPAATLLSVLGMAYLMNHSGMTLSIGLPLMELGGKIFPSVAFLLGVLGCTLTGSVVGSNALFGNLVGTVSAENAFALAALCSGGALGKIITPQNLAIAGSQIPDSEKAGTMGKITSKMIFYALVFSAVEVIWIYLLRLLA